MTVPNRFPLFPDGSSRRLAIVGEAPGKDEEVVGEPFVGASGRLLRLVLAQCGAVWDSSFIGNICQQRPPDNEIEAFDWDGPEIQDGIRQLLIDLAAYKPNCVLALGRTAFKLFNPAKCYVEKSKEHIPLSNWRGSVFMSPQGYKVVGAFHPAYILRSFSDIAYFRLDVARAVRHSKTDVQVSSPTRTGLIRPTLEDVIRFLQDLRAKKTPASFDIEGYTDSIGVTMLGIAPRPDLGLVIPLFIDGKNYWSEEAELVVWQEVAGWLADATCPKTAHNSFYETVVLGWRHRCLVAGRVDDTMMLQWEHFNELEKSLAVTASIWTEEQYYKDARESTGNAKLTYNLKDATVTQECKENMLPRLKDGSLAHYEFNISLIPAYTYIHLRGCRFDIGRAKAHHDKEASELAVLQEKINAALGRDLNVKSTPDKQWLLYEKLGYEPYKRYGPTTKEEVLHRYYQKYREPVLQWVIQAISRRTRLSDIAKLIPNGDGRIRTSYDLVGTVTGRLSSRESSLLECLSDGNKTEWTASGTNLQNVTRALRDCFIADSDDYDFFQCDLSGADAWTVGADLAALGRPAMLDDLRAGVKIPKALLAMLEVLEKGEDPGKIARATSQELKAITDAIQVPEGILTDGRPADWKYVSMKRVQHGTNYDAREDTISATIFKDSDGLIDVPPPTVKTYQMLYRLRYDTSARLEWIRRELSKDGTLTTAAGVRRRYFGIRNPRMIDDEIVKQAAASEPQTNTTYATNLALRNLWYSTDNRRRTGALFVEPLLQIHDALAGQFPTRLREFARAKLHEWFDNTLRIHSIEIVIPFDGKYGPSWGACKDLSKMSYRIDLYAGPLDGAILVFEEPGNIIALPVIAVPPDMEPFPIPDLAQWCGPVARYGHKATWQDSVTGQLNDHLRLYQHIPNELPV